MARKGNGRHDTRALRPYGPYSCTAYRLIAVHAVAAPFRSWAASYVSWNNYHFEGRGSLSALPTTFCSLRKGLISMFYVFSTKFSYYSPLKRPSSFTDAFWPVCISSSWKGEPPRRTNVSLQPSSSFFFNHLITITLKKKKKKKPFRFYKEMEGTGNPSPQKKQLSFLSFSPFQKTF